MTAQGNFEKLKQMLLKGGRMSPEGNFDIDRFNIREHENLVTPEVLALTDDSGRTLLQIAVNNLDPTHYPPKQQGDITSFFLSRGANPNEPLWYRPQGQTLSLLTLAIQAGKVEVFDALMADPRTDVNLGDVKPLHAAASRRGDFAEKLLENGADPLARNQAGRLGSEIARGTTKDGVSQLLKGAEAVARAVKGGLLYGTPPPTPAATGIPRVAAAMDSTPQPPEQPATRSTGSQSRR